jgi:hypothetical protein
MDAITWIPAVVDESEASPSEAATLVLGKLIDFGLGRGLVRFLKETGQTLFTTFYAPALAADQAGCPRVFCLVTDADCHRVWVARSPRESRIRYLAPSPRVVRRLLAFGIQPERVALTGFPLPAELIGESGQLALARRLVRLDPKGSFRVQHRPELERTFPQALAVEAADRPLGLTFAVGGAGAQADLVDEFLPSLKPWLLGGELKLHLVAGIREGTSQRFERSLSRTGLTSQLGQSIEIVRGSSFSEYYRELCRLFLATDVLWTKPSELSFYAALGLPLVLSDPLGGHERYNRRFLLEQGAALTQPEPRHAGAQLSEWLHDGTLARAAWSGYRRLPRDGTSRILEELTRTVRF